MKKIAIFWDKRFENNNFKNVELGNTLNPFLEIAKINGIENTISSNLLQEREDKDDFIIVCLLTISRLNIVQYIKMFREFPKNKKYLIAYEPPIVAMLNYSRLSHMFFDRVYTWNDSLVDNKKYFKFIHHNTLIDAENVPNIEFSQKKFLSLINGNRVAFWKNELYSKRDKFIRYAEKNHLDFDLYGRWWDRPNSLQKIIWYIPYTSYRGSVDDKIGTLAGYKFNICFENMSNTPGYITEKIFDSFKARSVPVYWGASNIEKYIPKNCFIDYRDFLDFDKLLVFLLKMNENEYNSYIKNIEVFLLSKKAKIWFDKDWAEDFIKSLN